MIQRKQTIFLILAVLLNGVVPFTDIMDRFISDPSGWILSGWVSALALATGALIYAIFLFKNRILQLKWVLRGGIFQLLATGAASGVFITSGDLNRTLLPEAIGVSILFAALGCIVFARFFIMKDEKLVKSMDRIR